MPPKKIPFLSSQMKKKFEVSLKALTMRERIRRPPYFLNPKCDVPDIKSLPGLNKKERSQYERVKRFSIDESRDLDKVRREVSRRMFLISINLTTES